eukprot:3432435-Prymnesium_polylepis.1
MGQDGRIGGLLLVGGLHAVAEGVLDLLRTAVDAFGELNYEHGARVSRPHHRDAVDERGALRLERLLGGGRVGHLTRRVDLRSIEAAKPWVTGKHREGENARCANPYQQVVRSADVHEPRLVAAVDPADLSEAISRVVPHVSADALLPPGEGAVHSRVGGERQVAGGGAAAAEEDELPLVFAVAVAAHQLVLEAFCPERQQRVGVPARPAEHDGAAELRLAVGARERDAQGAHRGRAVWRERGAAVGEQLE